MTQQPRAAGGSALPRLVATDLDGTLLDAAGEVSPRTREVLRRLDDRGVPVVMVTARPLRWMADLWPLVGAHGQAVVSNGAIWWDVAAERAREVRGLDPEIGVAMCGDIRAAVPEATFALEFLDGIRLERDYPEPDHVAPGTPVGEVSEIFTDPAVKLLARARPGSDTDPTAFREAVAAAVGERAVVTWTVPELIEISARGVTKGATLARVCESLGVPPDQVVAFGDMPNDLPLLDFAGLSYAVANAHPSVLAAADRVAADHRDDGVARALSELFDLGVPWPEDEAGGGS